MFAAGGVAYLEISGVSARCKSARKTTHESLKCGSRVVVGVVGTRKRASVVMQESKAVLRGAEQGGPEVAPASGVGGGEMESRQKDGFRSVVKKLEDLVNGGMEAFVTSAPEPVVRVIARMLFYPTLYWNRLMKKEDGVRRWFDLIVPGIILGALPERKILESLKQEQRVDVFLNTVREWPGLTKEYERLGFEQKRVPMTDFMPPKLEDIEECVDHLRDLVEAKKKTVYVHCKAGRGRSATVVMAYLMKYHGMTPLEAQRFLEERRPHVLHVLHERDVIKEFQQKHGTPS